MTDQIRVLLVDDQDLIRTGFRLLLMGEPDIAVVGEARDGQAALDELARLGGACDVVLMDVRMPRMNGIDATAQIAARFPNVRVLVLTTFDLDEYAQSAIQAGASGFLLKDARPTELVDAIQRVATGDAVMAPSVMKRMLEQMRVNGLMAPGGVVGANAAYPNTGGAEQLAPRSQGRADSPQWSAGESVAVGAGPGSGPSVGQASGSATGATAAKLEVLTEREREVLVLIAEGLNNAEISARLFLSESTVKTHVGRVLFKLELRDRIHAVIFAKELGL
ncbi:MAG: response regulator transcription factor [Ancrocorticia sp.]